MEFIQEILHLVEDLIYQEENIMNKTELVSAISEKTGLKKDDAKKAVDAFTAVVTDALANGDSVALVGFGTFDVSERKERTGLNPLTKEEIVIPAAKLPKFKAGRGLKEAVNK
jgi:DNA-binding protein HU-beta